MTYPNAYCVKCGTHTDTLQKHTVTLQNQARALRGVCPDCASDVYKILPKGRDFGAKVKMTEGERQRYPDAFCVKCQEHTPTLNPHTVILDNQSRAVTGSCKCCGTEVYRIIGNVKDGRAAGQPMSARNLRAAAASAPLADDVKIRDVHKVHDGPSRVLRPRFAFDAKAGDARRVPITRRVESPRAPSSLSYLFAAGVIVSIVAGFVLIAVF
jgi:hypothetical protein